jgi:sulfate permease, SulP family
LFLSPLIERIPLAALVGVMFVVSQQTFAWASLRVINKVPLNDVLVIIAVTVITVFTDLATAVLCGIVIAALNFAWQQARQLYADEHLEADGSKLYRVHGTLFFASTTTLSEPVRPGQRSGPGDARLSSPELCRLFGHCRADDIARALCKAGKHLRVLHVSERCKKLLKRARVQHD